ncbi:hypothetical protein [Microbispora bryophytorum]|uniref:hypothetical protein n=1 Tax=Microbispora bryophytorum TaxID=1460882 RepID=UPI0034100D04
MDWFFEGLGTLLVGILLGASGDRLFLKLTNRQVVRQSQKAGDKSQQTQVGRDYYASSEKPKGRVAEEKPSDE